MPKDWLDRLLDAFFSFRPARGMPCHFHNYEHPRDMIVVSKIYDSPQGNLKGEASIWLLHDHPIAIYEPIEDGRYRLVLSNEGYHTDVTIRRLNSILYYLGEKVLGTKVHVSFHLKYNNVFKRNKEERREPDHTYVYIFGETYRMNSAELEIDLKNKTYSVNIYPRYRFLYFDEHKELRYLYRLFKKAEEYYNKLYHDEDFVSEINRLINAYSEISNRDPDNPKVKKMHDLIFEYNTLEREFRRIRNNIVDKYGVYENWKNKAKIELSELIDKMARLYETIIPEFKKSLVTAEILMA